MSTPSRRRWYQFSLRTMFVGMIRTMLVAVAVVVLFVGWQANIVRQRHAMLAELSAHGCYWSAGTEAELIDKPWTLIPMTRRLLGDTPVMSIFVGGSPLENRYMEIHALFPEAMMPIE